MMLGAYTILAAFTVLATVTADLPRHEQDFVYDTATGLQYYVSAKGDDTKSGKSPADAFATFERVLEEVRSLKNGSASGKLPSTVYFNFVADGGPMFPLKEPVRITAAESGDPQSSVVFRSYQSAEPVTISGGYMINKWEQSGAMWTAQLPDTIKPFHQLFVNGSRRLIANTGVLQYEKAGTGYEDLTDYDEVDYPFYKRRVEQPAAGDAYYIVYQPGQVPASVVEEKNLEVVIYEIWTASVHPVTAIYPGNRTIHLLNPIAARWMASDATGHRYILQGSKQFLKPGTFSYDHSSHVLTYMPMDSETLDMDAVVPQLVELVTVTGDPNSGSLVANVEFHNLGFAHAMADFSNCFGAECSAQSADFLVSAAVRFEYAVNCTMSQSKVAHVGGYGVWLDQGCQNNTLDQLHVFDLGAGGVRIGRGIHGIVDTKNQTNFNVLSNSILEDGGHVFKEGCGVLLQAAAHNTITHNLINHFRYTGVSIGWSWGYAPTTSPGNVVSYNHIHHIGMGELSDMGCVYSLGIQIGAQVVHNLCHDVWSYGYGGWGYYTDEGSSNMTYAYNIAYHTKAACLHQHYGENNQFINNVFAFPHNIPCPDKTGGHCFDTAVKSSRHAPGSGPGAMSSFNFERNIVYIENGTLFASSTPKDFLFANQTFDNNIYWNAINHGAVNFPPSNHPSTLAQWQAMGKDKHSLVADPLFTKASEFDFSQLASNSPALKLGIEPIDTSKIGPQPSP